MNRPVKDPIELQLDEMKEAGGPVLKGVRASHHVDHAKVNQQILGRWLPQWYAQAVANWSQIKDQKGIKLLTQGAKGVPAVVVGIGPSLDENIETLKLAHGRALIICTDAALRPLVANGVRPDLVVTFDGRVTQASLFEGVETEDLVLVASSCTNPLTHQTWKGPKLFFNMDHSGVELTDVCLPTIYPHFGKIPNVGTVGNEAVVMAWLMGCSRILTLGMDLCYQQVKGAYRYRCQDYKLTSIVHAQWERSENKLLYDNDQRLEGSFEVQKNGKTFRTDPELDVYLDVLVRAIGRWDLPVTDCSPAGLLGEFVERLPFREALDTYASRVLSEGETVVYHLNQILGKGK